MEQLTLEEVAQELRDSDKKIQLIYAFNSTGKTRLSQKFKKLIETDNKNNDIKILYYNAFTEDLFYWDHNSSGEPKLLIQSNGFTTWILRDQGQDQNIIGYFQDYSGTHLIPNFDSDFSSISFYKASGNDEKREVIKISKGEESLFVWSIFYSLLEEVIEVLNIPDTDERSTNQFDELKYIFIDDPVSSLDENNLIELAVNLAQLIKSSESDLKFIITTHNPLFYNVLSHELNKAKQYFLRKNGNGTYDLDILNRQQPFSYHLFLKKELEKAVISGHMHKYHFNFVRNILEKTSIFLGLEKWGDLLSKITTGAHEAYQTRIINISSHSNHSADEIYSLNDNDKRVLRYLINQIDKLFKLDFRALSENLNRGQE